MSRSVPLLLALLLLLPGFAAGEPANPFTGSAPPEAADGDTVPEERSADGSALSLRLSRLQGELQQRMSAFIRALHGERSSLVWASLLALGALYGVVHTLLPGHRKTVLFSYFMSEDARPVHGVVAGVSLAILHAGAAITIVLGSYWLIESSLNVAVSRANEIVQDLSAWLIVALGSLFLFTKVRHALSHSRHHHGPARAVEDDNPPVEPVHRAHHPGTRAPLSLPAIVLSGLVPCPGSTVVLLFSLSLGIVSVGIATVSAISFGMAVTLSVISVATITLKRTILAREGPVAHLLHHGIEIGAAAVMLLFGVALVLA
jgi:ABC-type nickel/cobalt efflux system permease component RcnA